MNASVSVVPIQGLPEIGSGDRLGSMIATATSLAADDIVVIAQKVVSKAEGRKRDPADVTPSAGAVELSSRLDKDPALVELILRESASVIRSDRVLIVETHSGLVCANAGIDSSNAGPGDGVLLLPEDPDASARRLRAEIEAVAGVRPAVIVSDSFGRPWRLGQTEVAIGCAGLAPVTDERGGQDRDGRSLEATVVATADELAAAADLVRGKAEGVPAVRIRGRADLVTDGDGPGAVALQRERDMDLFR